MDGAGPAPLADQIAGIVPRVWAESRLYREDETRLEEWLAVAGCVVRDEEFAMLLSKARGEFVRLVDHLRIRRGTPVPRPRPRPMPLLGVQRLEGNGSPASQATA